jgi:hypothetical protein
MNIGIVAATIASGHFGAATGELFRIVPLIPIRNQTDIFSSPGANPGSPQFIAF